MFGDIHNVKGRIKTIDKDLDISYIGNGQYEVTHKDSHFMTVPREELDDRTVKKIREVVYKNVNADILAEIEANNAKIDRRKDKDFKNLSEDLAKDIYPYIKRLD